MKFKFRTIKKIWKYNRRNNVSIVGCIAVLIYLQFDNPNLRGYSPTYYYNSLTYYYDYHQSYDYDAVVNNATKPTITIPINNSRNDDNIIVTTTTTTTTTRRRQSHDSNVTTNNPNYDNDKPYIVIHIGPPKTGTFCVCMHAFVCVCVRARE